jgi:hypothetical protein
LLVVGVIVGMSRWALGFGRRRFVADFGTVNPPVEAANRGAVEIDV